MRRGGAQRSVWPTRAKQQQHARRTHAQPMHAVIIPAQLPSEGPATMSLRRPPTRVELKADDIIEYEEVSARAWCSIILSQCACVSIYLPPLPFPSRSIHLDNERT